MSPFSLKNLDAAQLADCLGSLDLGAWQVDRSALAIEGLDRCSSPSAGFSMEQTSPASYRATFTSRSRVDTWHLANLLGSCEPGAWHTSPGTFEINGVDCAVTLVANAQSQ